MDNLPSTLFTLLFLPALWIIIVWLIGTFGGWTKLATSYPPQPDMAMETFYAGRCSMGIANYSHVVRFRADQMYLHVSIHWLFKPGHPPFSIPWQEITAKPRRVLFGKSLEVSFLKEPSVKLYLHGKSVNKLIAGSYGHLQY